jgi:hypothetical protein
LQIGGYTHLRLRLDNSHSGTLKLYASQDRGTNWYQVRQASVPAGGSSDSYIASWKVSPHADVKLVWTNGGSAQTTWRPEMSLDEQELDLPSVLPGAVAWFDPSEGTKSSSGLLDSWADRWGGKSASATGALRPTLGRTSGLNGRMGVTFGGTQYLFADNGIPAIFSGSQAYSVYMVRRTDSAYTSGDIILSMASGAAFILHGATGATATNFVWRNNGGGSSVNQAGTVALNNAIGVTADMHTGSVCNAWANGSLSINAAAHAQVCNSLTRFALGCRMFSSGAVDRIWNGDLGDLIMYKAEHSASHRASLESWLANRYRMSAP